MTVVVFVYVVLVRCRCEEDRKQTVPRQNRFVIHIQVPPKQVGIFLFCLLSFYKLTIFTLFAWIVACAKFALSFFMDILSFSMIVDHDVLGINSTFLFFDGCYYAGSKNRVFS